MIEIDSSKTNATLTDAFVRIRESVAYRRRHGVLRRHRRVVVYEGYPLAILVLGKADLVKAVELRKDFFEFLLCYILRDIAHVEGKHLSFSARQLGSPTYSLSK